MAKIQTYINLVNSFSNSMTILICKEGENVPCPIEAPLTFTYRQAFIIILVFMQRHYGYMENSIRVILLSLCVKLNG